CNASRFRAVSFSVSPLVRLEVLTEMLITSALKRNAASSNDVRVRVLGSTKKLISVLPRSAGTFLISRVPTCLKASAVSRMKLISSAESSRNPSRSLRVQRIFMKWERGLPARIVRHLAGRTVEFSRQDAANGRQDARAPDKRGFAYSFLDNSTASGSPSVCSRRTWTSSLGAVGKFLPT